MLISLELENWMSFRDPITFSMVAGKERHHRQRIPKLGSRLRVLPVSAIYGANASGKSNFYEAFRFARNFILEPPRRDDFIPVSPFKLDQKRNAPVSMTFEFMSNGKIYSYSFTATSREVQKEKLTQVYLNGDEKILFDLNRAAKHKNVHFPCAGEDKDKDKVKNLSARLNFVLEGTLANQLFINNAHWQRVELFKDVISWFDSIIIIGPGTEFGYTSSANEVDFSVITDYIRNLDTGIDEFFLAEKKLTADDIQEMAGILKDKNFAKRIDDLEDGVFLNLSYVADLSVVKRSGEVFVLRPQTKRHYNETGGTVSDWDISFESEGTCRALQLLPMVYFRTKKDAVNSVYIVDELERSLHPGMARWIIKSFLECCTEKTRSQLIFTTHNPLLMDQSFLRRDEVWITEREKASNVSRMFSISDFNGVRNDTDLQANYLMGVFGGTPKVSARVSCV